MKQEYDKELTPEVREKMKKNLVYVGIFSIVMLFAGFTSAYIVSMGDSFWMKYDFPPAFYISTVIILLSSIVLQFGISRARKGNAGIIKIAVPLTFILGIGFAYFQFKGYGQLAQLGANPVNKLMVTNGRYGLYYEMKVNNIYLEVDGNDYKLANKIVSEKQKAAISKFAAQLLDVDSKRPTKINNYGIYTLMYKNQAVTLKDGYFYVQDSVKLQYVDVQRMKEFAVHIKDGRGDFFHKGKFGKDFKVYYKGVELQYNERTLSANGKKLDAAMQLKMDSAADTASTYLWLITFLHLLHILATLIYMLRMSIRSFSGVLAENDYLSIRMGAIFWHFLGALWIYLLLFLLFIH